MRKETILLVDDENGILDMLETLLKKEGYQHIHKATTGEKAIQLVQDFPIDLIILDVMLPDFDGFEVCRKLRRLTQVPILFVTARSSDFDKLMGLTIGGDDYVTKPFNPLEVVARIHVQLRRERILKESAHPKANKLVDGSLVINKDTGQVSMDGNPIHCTAKEYELLIFLCEHPHRIFTAGQLYEQVWKSSYLGDEKTVAVHISKLRKKIEKDPKKPERIVNLRGIGYKFISSEKSESQ
ncbi:response regulator transcription factor [Kroppenstedtia pulmonis]|uniref:Response regulator transcription factor n=1 Tax=Kroppenstedtia pulmonis TaxID=1380685 RepID=A0A7D3XI09_9BACL|nr:response regulator transcription factor [Kroppenstedtia pulmonis]QKG83619.1 response regulator transcription factor [Kroppenstedtia pulmonis]